MTFLARLIRGFDVISVGREDPVIIAAVFNGLLALFQAAPRREAAGQDVLLGALVEGAEDGWGKVGSPH